MGTTPRLPNRVCEQYQPLDEIDRRKLRLGEVPVNPIQ
jgi:hypothetical protein